MLLKWILEELYGLYGLDSSASGLGSMEGSCGTVMNLQVP
jgi:hypothetical protein